MLAREITWRWSDDAERFNNPLVGLAKGFHTSPALEVRDRFVKQKEFDARMELLTQLVVPIAPSELNKIVSIDGEWLGLRISFVRIEWWNDGPVSWKRLVDWAAETRKWLAAVCLDSMVQIPKQEEVNSLKPYPLE